MIDRGLIGFTSKPRVAAVEAGQLKFFAQATGEKNPIYFDEEAARAAGHRAIPAPPTFTFSLSMAAPAGDLRLDKLGIDLRRVLHAEQTFKHHRPIYAGDVITLTTEISDIYDKKGGALEFMAQDTRAVNQDGELCTEMRVTLVVRNA